MEKKNNLLVNSFNCKKKIFIMNSVPIYLLHSLKMSLVNKLNKIGESGPP